MLRKVQISQLARKRMVSLRKSLRKRFGDEVSKKALSELADAMESLGQFPEKGINISKMYDLETDYYYLVASHNYIVYRFDDEEVVILRLFDEREDFMNTLFGLSGRTQESIDYWGE